MPVLVRQSNVQITGVRITYEDLEQVFEAIDNAKTQSSPSKTPTSVAIIMKGATKERQLTSLADVTNYEPDDLDYLRIRGSGNSFFAVDLKKQVALVGTVGPAACDVAEISTGFNRLATPRRLAYLICPKRNNPYRVELMTKNRATLAARNAESRISNRNIALGVITLIVTVAGTVAGILLG